MSGNGVGLGAVLQAVNTVAGDVRSLSSGQQSLASDVRAVSSEVKRLWSELHELRREMTATRGDVSLLRQTVTEYHAAVIGHGVLISAPDDRVRRADQHLGLTPTA